MIMNFCKHSRERILSIAMSKAKGVDIKVIFWRFRVFFKYNEDKIRRSLLNFESSPSKKEDLRTLTQIYDPLGVLSNILINLKILLSSGETGWSHYLVSLKFGLNIKRQHFSEKFWARLTCTYFVMRVRWYMQRPLIFGRSRWKRPMCSFIFKN